MNIKVTEKPITKVLEIGRLIIGNEVIIDDTLYFFVPRSNGVHVFRIDKFNNTCSFVTIQGHLANNLKVSEYLDLLKQRIIPSFIKNMKTSTYK